LNPCFSLSPEEKTNCLSFSATCTFSLAKEKGRGERATSLTGLDDGSPNTKSNKRFKQLRLKNALPARVFVHFYLKKNKL